MALIHRLLVIISHLFQGRELYLHTFFRRISCGYVDREIDQRVEGANGADVARFGSLDAQVLGLAVDAFTGGALVVDDLVEGTLAIQGDAHQPTSFLVDVLDTAFLFAKLLVVAGFWPVGSGKSSGQR